MRPGNLNIADCIASDFSTHTFRQQNPDKTWNSRLDVNHCYPQAGGLQLQVGIQEEQKTLDCSASLCTWKQPKTICIHNSSWLCQCWRISTDLTDMMRGMMPVCQCDIRH